MGNLTLRFERASEVYQSIVFGWLAEPHMQEFWDNSQAHKDDILHFIRGEKQSYFYGTTQYWVGLINNEPFSFILTDPLLPDQSGLTNLHKAYLSKTGHSIALDFGIGNSAFIGKGLAASTLESFIIFYRLHIDKAADTFFIDPNANNPRALYVYAKAGFQPVGDFEVQSGIFKGNTSSLMMKSFS